MSIDNKKKERAVTLRIYWFWGLIVICMERKHIWKSHLPPGQFYYSNQHQPSCVQHTGCQWRPTLALDFSLDLNNIVSCYLSKRILHFILWNVPHKIFVFWNNSSELVVSLIACLSVPFYLSLSLSQLNYKAKHENEKFKCHIPPDTPAFIQHKVNAYNLSDVSSCVLCYGISWQPVFLFLDCFTEKTFH